MLELLLSDPNIKGTRYKFVSAEDYILEKNSDDKAQLKHNYIVGINLQKFNTKTLRQVADLCANKFILAIDNLHIACALNGLCRKC